jgi:hypothetical protein
MQALAVARAPEALDVDARLVELARAGAPLRRALAAIAAAVVARRAWDALGFVRARDYAVERLGLSARQLQDLAHVDGRFRRLPRVEAAFVVGRITWTKARLLCRVATPEDEALWVEAAERMTARALAREVRALDARALEGGGYERDEDGADATPRETVWLKLTPRVKARWGRAQMLACRVAGESLRQDTVAELVAAEVMSALALDVDLGPATPLATRGADGYAGQGPSDEALVPSPASSTGGANGCTTDARATLPPFLSALVEGLEAAEPRELDARLRRVAHLEQRLLGEMGPLLLEVARSRSYRLYGCASLAAFAREWLGMSPRRAQALLRLERAGQRHPVLREAYRSGRLSWTQAHALVPVLGVDEAAPWHERWVAHAERVTVRRLEEDVERALTTGDFDPAADLDDAQTGARPTSGRGTEPLFFTAPADVARLFKAVLASVQRRIERLNGRLASESEALDAILEHCFETWSVPNGRVPLEHRVFERDGWRCQVPGCTSYRNLHDHHIRFRSAGGSDDLSNRVTLCAAHHLRGVHAGLIRIRGRAPDGLYFETPLATYGPGERRLGR